MQLGMGVSAIPLFVGAIIDNELILNTSVSLTLIIASIGVYFFIIGGTNWTSLQKLLQEGEYDKVKKKKNSAMESLSVVYWTIATTIYLAYSFITNDWHRTWIVWPIAGVLYGAVAAIYSMVASKKKD